MPVEDWVSRSHSTSPALSLYFTLVPSVWTTLIGTRGRPWSRSKVRKLVMTGAVWPSPNTAICWPWPKSTVRLPIGLALCPPGWP